MRTPGHIVFFNVEVMAAQFYVKDVCCVPPFAFYVVYFS